jgi:mono/diheme cytochrome c family protein
VRRFASLIAGILLAALLAGCGKDAPEKSDAELGLNAQQAAGRQVYRLACARCHNAYSSAPLDGRSLQGLFRKKYLPSGLPANDRFVGQTIQQGRGMMPAFGGSLTSQQFDDLLAYLHTL